MKPAPVGFCKKYFQKGDMAIACICITERRPYKFAYVAERSGGGGGGSVEWGSCRKKKMKRKEGLF